MKSCFFTIITPTLNSEKYLEECINSVESQSFNDWEHIFIDSFSTDRTIKILKEYKKRHPEKVRIYQYPKKGISNAFNNGIKHSRGKYLNFLGSDDLLEKNALKIVYAKMKTNKYSWCYGNASVINSFGKVLIKKIYSNFDYLGLVLSFYICHQSTFMSKKIFIKYGFFRDDLKYAMDHEYFLRIGNVEAPAYINKNICFFRKHSSSMTLDKWQQQINEKLKLNLKYSPYFFKPLVVVINRLVYIKKLFSSIYRVLFLTS